MANNKKEIQKIFKSRQLEIRKLKKSENEKKVDQLTYLIDNEIQDIKEDNRQPGWTRWAIFYTIIVLFGFLINDLENSTIDFRYVSGFVILISSILIAFYTFTLLLKILFQENYFIENRIFQANQFINKKYSLLWVFCWMVALFVLIINHQNITLVNKILYLVVYAITIFLQVSSILLSFTNWPLPTNPKFNRGSILFLSSLFSVIAFAISIHIFSLSNFLENLGEFRVAGIIVILGGLFFIIFLMSNNEIPITVLRDIRKKLLLGTITYSEAKDQTENLLTGIKIPDYFHIYQLRIINQSLKIEQYFLELQEFLLEVTLDCESGKNDIPTQKTINNIHKFYIKYEKEIEPLKKRLDRNYEFIFKRLNFLLRQCQLDNYHVDEIEEQLSNLNKQNKHLLEVIRASKNVISEFAKLDFNDTSKLLEITKE